MASQFAIVFREHVVPRLRRRCYVNGVLVHCGITEWGDAFNDVLRLACKRGAVQLDDATFAELQDWIATELTKQIEAADIPVTIADIQAAATSEPIKWALAAVFPEYRKVLLDGR